MSAFPKTLHITNSWHPRSGGIRTFYRALLDAANEAGREMRLVVPAEETSVETVGAHGIIYHVKAPRAPFNPSYRILYPNRALIPGMAVHRILASERPDIVEVCDKFTMNWLGGLMRVGLAPGLPFRPLVVALSCERLDRTVECYVGGAPWLRALALHYLRWCYFPLADHHIAVSGYVAGELREVADGHKIERGVWIGPMGVEAETFGRAKHDPELRGELLALTGGCESSVLLVFAGRMAPEKNLPLLFGTMACLMRTPEGPRFRLLMVGDGDGRAGLARAAEAAAPGRVRFLGHRDSPSELARLLAACDVFVHPNPREPFGIAPLEAMAAGLPLVAPSSGGVLSYASHDNAYLAEPTPAAFAAAILSTLSDDAARERKVALARNTARRFQWRTAAAHYLGLYARLHARSCSAAAAVPDLEPAFVSTRTRRTACLHDALS